VNNVVGIKPTVGLTSRSLVIRLTDHQDTVGPIARTVKDAAYLLQAIVGKDDHDNYTSAIPWSVPPDFVAACDMSALQGKRIGVSRNYLDGMPPQLAPVHEAFNAALKVLEEAGATIVDNVDFPAWRLPSTASDTVMEVSFRATLKNYLDQLVVNPTGIKTLEDVRALTQNLTVEEYPS